ncbi:MAG TPA: class I SAM-dependent methyltransferase, partial [Chroococcales cyanobacterium]
MDEHVDVPTWTIARCKGCTVETVYPRPSIQQIERYYANQTEPNEYEQQYYVRVPETKLKGFEDLARRLTSLNKKPGRLLEIGCAAGWLLERARRQGWDVQGLEASPKFHSFATGELKLPVTLGTISSVDTDRLGTFDTIVMFDVLEHLHDPVSDLAKIRKLLKPDGRLVVATCAIDSFFARFYGLAWRQLVVSHTFYWTRKSL